MTPPFWINDPTILFHKESILQLWPLQNMTFESKLNAISRLVILLTIIGFIFTRNISLLIVCVITLAIIYALYKLRKQKIVSSLVKKEGFAVNNQTSPSMTTNPVTLESELRTNFHPTTKKNPFGNVLLTDISDNPDRKSAAPSFNPDVHDDITSAVKKQTQMLNPGITNATQQLYGDLYDSYQLDKSLMRFYSTANSRVENDAHSFKNYLYGEMHSSKEDGVDGAMMRVKNNWQWINP